MIYEFPIATAPIRQGDVFVRLPRVDVSLGRIALFDGVGISEGDWAEESDSGRTIAAVLPIRVVAAIVVSQDCDAIRAEDVSLCEIRRFQEVEGKASQTKDAKGWVSILTQHARINQKWFYLPPDRRLGFAEKMAVDFTTTLRVQRTDLESFRQFRMGRLNPTADEHFRERLSEFFRRYPYDEWYPFDAAELAEYRKRNPDAAPFSWQQPVKDELS